MSSKKEKEIVSHPKVHFSKIINRLLSGIFLYLFCVSNLGGLDNYIQVSKNDVIGILGNGTTYITDSKLNISESDLKALLSKLNNDKGREKFIDLLSKRSNTKYLDFFIKTINLGLKNFSGLSDDVLAKIVNYSDDLLLKLDGDLPKIKNALNLNPGLNTAWEALARSNLDDVIRRNVDYLDNITKHSAKTGQSADEIVTTAKNNENGVEQFFDELEDTPASGCWDLNPFDRGRCVEDGLGQNLPETFKTIDKYDDVTGEATSIKSIDLDAKTYQTVSKLKSRLNKYADELDRFTEYTISGVTIGDAVRPVNIKHWKLHYLERQLELNYRP